VGATRIRIRHLSCASDQWLLDVSARSSAVAWSRRVTNRGEFSPTVPVPTTKPAPTRYLQAFGRNPE